jgi:DNA ligase-1
MSNSSASTFKSFAQTAQKIADTRGINGKIAVFEKYLSTFENPADIKLALRYFTEGAFSKKSGRRAVIGHRTTQTAAAEFLEMDYDLVFKACRTATGSGSETIEKLMRNWPLGQEKRQEQDLTLTEMYDWFEKLEAAKNRDEKSVFIQECWKLLSPVEIKFMIRVLMQYSLRIGFETKSIIRGLSETFDADSDDVRFAYMLNGSIEETAEQLLNKDLHTVEFEFFQPVHFMLASPISSASDIDFEKYIAEEKFDGMRCQAHIKDGKIALFSRDQNDISHSFPELDLQFNQHGLNNMVLDGEICVFKDDTIQPFQLLQKRMGVKKPSKKLLKDYPVLFIGYDLLFSNLELHLDKPFLKRREQLETVHESTGLPISTVKELTNEEDVEKLFKLAKDHGNEGLMLKRKDSVYEYGQRGNKWLKVKEPAGTLDTVIMYAHAGSGKRGGTYSDFTLGINVKEDDRYEEEFIPIGKAYGGFTNDELKRLNKEIRPLIAEKYGPTLGLIPKIVVELEFEEIQVNRRTKANYTLRLPRFKAIRWDLSPDDTDTLKDVERMFEEELNRERTENSVKPAFLK